MAANESYEDHIERVGFYSNCLLESLKAFFIRGASIQVTRNRRGRFHFYWALYGNRFEFYARGRADRTYYQNLLYKGYIKQI